MDLKTLNAFCTNILQNYLDNVSLSEGWLIAETLKEFPAQNLWHVEIKAAEKTKEYILWKKSAWLASEERKRKAREEQRIYNEILDTRREAYEQLKKAICYTLDLPDVNDVIVLRMAERVMKGKKSAAEKLFGVTLNNLPELPNKHIVYNEHGKKQYEL